MNRQLTKRKWTRQWCLKGEVRVCSVRQDICLTQWIQVVLPVDKLQGGIKWVVFLLHLFLPPNAHFESPAVEESLTLWSLKKKVWIKEWHWHSSQTWYNEYHYDLSQKFSEVTQILYFKKVPIQQFRYNKYSVTFQFLHSECYSKVKYVRIGHLLNSTFCW